MKNRFIAIALVVIYVLSLLTPVYAQDSHISHTVDYLVDGRIDFTNQLGHICNTGGEMKQTITGDGQLEKSMSLLMVQGKIELSDSNEFITATDAVNNLTVTTAIELCTPPKFHTDIESGKIRTEKSYWWYEDPLLEDELWLNYWEEVYEGIWQFTGVGEPSAINPDWEWLYSTSISRYILPEELTDQIWAVSVSADPGHSGVLSNDFVAAYGEPMWSDYQDPDGRRFPAFITDPDLVEKDKWARGQYRNYYVGPDYVGDYFLMDQYAYLSQGKLKRFIDISSPYSHALLHEDVTVTGFAETEENFALYNMIPGENVIEEWWNMIDDDSTISKTIAPKELFLNHNADYSFSGNIDFMKQAGHLCNSGGELKQSIEGDGNLSKKMTLEMIAGFLAVDDKNEFTTALNADRNLTVTSVIELCAPPKQFIDNDFFQLHYVDVNAPISGHIQGRFPVLLGGASHWFGGIDALVFGPYMDGDFVEPLFNPDGLYRWWPEMSHPAADVSEQIWAVRVEAEPGESGLLDKSFEAAHGSGGGYFPDPSSEVFDNTWIKSTDGRGIFPVVGSSYVGSYFTIEQRAKTTGGVLKRYIDISSPWSHGYLFEDMTVTGKAEVKEAFEMQNLPAGSDSESLWWDIFGPEKYKIVDDYYLPGLYVENMSGFYFGNTDSLIYDWLNELFWTHDVSWEIFNELYSLYENNQWDEVLNRLENEIDGFNRNDAPDPDNLIHLPPVIIINFPWPYPDWFWLY